MATLPNPATTVTAASVAAGAFPTVPTVPAATAASSRVLGTAAPVLSVEAARQLHVEKAVAADDGRPVVVPAPQPEEPYYWEEGGDPEPPVVKLVGHNVHWISMQLFHGLEAVGEMFSGLLGLTNSRYEWAVEAARAAEEELEEEERREAQRQRWEAIQRMNTMERAAAGGAAAPHVPDVGAPTTAAGVGAATTTGDAAAATGARGQTAAATATTDGTETA